LKLDRAAIKISPIRTLPNRLEFSSPRKISSVQKEYLDTLGLGEEIFYKVVG